ncbi:asparaginase [Lentinula aciculospora]|uniref:Asparaginase n=1 Tax=Lentinula aciculospora TaxID=153920 RepID=A0A9W9DGN4_9AGAR|nr:asparaginase [Lentinula aciculospora]
MTVFDSANEEQPLLARTVGRSQSKYVLVIHGGAGTMSRKKSTNVRLKAYHDGLRVALSAGYKVLKEGGEAMDAAVAAVAALEDNILFNAGKGAVFNTAGKNELEASIMLSKPPASHPSVPSSRRGFGLTLLTHIRNPSKLARELYLTPSAAPHAFLSGDHAESIAESLGITLVDPSYFFSEARWKEHRRGLGLPDTPCPSGSHALEEEFKESWSAESLDMYPTGTVGAVALDVRGCICAVTSTGGRTNKLVGRIGDTPIMSAGYWAEEWENKRGWLKKAWNTITGKKDSSKMAVGISGTGDGDYFIRQATASTIARRVQFLGEPITTAAKVAVETLRQDGGVGGVIVLDVDGNVATPLNCEGMYRGLIREDGVMKTAVFDDEVLE